MADTGADLINAVKQAAEFGVTKKQALLGLFTQIVDVQAIGLQAAQGMLVTEAFYWDLNDATRSFSARFAQRFGGKVPTANQAGVYSSVLAYLHAVKAAGTIDGEAVMAEMRRAPIQDELFGTVIGAPGWTSGARHVQLPREVAVRVEVEMGRLPTVSPYSRARRRSARWTRAAARCHEIGEYRCRTTRLARRGLRLAASEQRDPVRLCP